MVKKILFRIIISFTSTFKKLINHYVEIKNEHTPEYWKQFVYYSIFLLTGIISLFIIVPNIVFNLLYYNYIYVIFLLFLALTFFFLLLARKLSFQMKSKICPFLFYIMGIYLVVVYGPDLDSFSWLFTFVIMISIFHTFKAAAAASLLNLVSLIILGILQTKGIIRWENITPYPFFIFFIGSVNFFALNLIISFAFNILLTRIYTSYTQVYQARDAIILGLAKLAEYRDADTGGHLERIRHFTKVLAVNLQKEGLFCEYITDEYIEDLVISSILHDIGKVGIPDSILLKKGKLTEDEFSIIKQHPLFGKQMLAEIGKKADYFSYIEIATAIAYSHHEKWDGTGYPLGLKEEEIPLSARIVAVVDVYDALRSKRVYKEPFSHEESVAITKAEWGKHFDPAIIDVFLATEEEFMQIYDENM